MRPSAASGQARRHLYSNVFEVFYTMISDGSAGFVVVGDGEPLDIESLISFSDEDVADWFCGYGGDGNGGEGDVCANGVGEHTGFFTCCI